MKHITLLLFTFLVLNGQVHIDYAKNELHTLTPKKGNLSLELNILMMNDTIDLLNIKEQEFGSNTDFNNIGDLKGYDLAIRYSILDDLMVSARYSKQEIQYSSSWLENTHLDLYTRYNFIQNSSSLFNSGFSMDFGYVSNTLKDFYIRDTDTLNKAIAKYNIPGTITQNPVGTLYTPPGKAPIILQAPYMSIENTQDTSYYLRALIGFHDKNSYTNFYMGLKLTDITSSLSSTQQVINLAALEGAVLPKILDRDEKTIFTGFNYTLDKNPFIYEFNYQYERYIRDSGLDYINSNHIISASLSYPINKNLLLTASGEIMYRQLNGQIPYLYNKYTQTSYDHKYGYASTGLIFRF